MRKSNAPNHTGCDQTMSIKLKILNPENMIKEEDVDYVRLSTERGSFGVLPGHVPMAAHLKKSQVIYTKDNKSESVEIPGGNARILPDSVTVFAD